MLQSTIIISPLTYFKTSVLYFIRNRIVFPPASAGKVAAATASDQLPRGDVRCQPSLSQRFPSSLPSHSGGAVKFLASDVHLHHSMTSDSNERPQKTAY